MIEIKDLLSRFQNIILGEEAKKEVIKDVLNKTIGVSIETKDIEIKNNIIYLNIKPIYKNEVFLKQEKIFLQMEEVFGKKNPQGIR